MAFSVSYGLNTSMKVKMNESSVTHKDVFIAGQVYELPDETAVRFLNSGAGEAVREHDFDTLKKATVKFTLNPVEIITPEPRKRKAK